MELICEYDLMRLRRYAPVQNGIHFLEHSALHAFSFQGLNYFNYAFKTDATEIAIDEVNSLSAFYANHGIKDYTILSPLAEPNLLDAGFKIKTSFEKQVLPSLVAMPTLENTLFEKADLKNIVLFTQTYLDSFEAGPKDLMKVSMNFSQLLDVPNLELYLMKDHDDRAVGVVVLFVKEGKALLAGGAVLPEYRSNNYHKNGIRFRVNYLLSKYAPNYIETWTYVNSQSNKNMAACGFITEETFHLYASS